MDFAKRVSTLRKKLDNLPILAELDRVDDAKAIAGIVKELDKSFTRYAKEAEKPITKIDFYWAGAEVAPWVPADVWGNVYANKELLLDSAGGFTPTPLPILYDVAEELGDHEAFDDLRDLFVAKSLHLAQQAIAKAARGKPFAAMTLGEPFTIVGTPGHDEPSVKLW
jgi:hypothetical protein